MLRPVAEAVIASSYLYHIFTLDDKYQPNRCRTFLFGPASAKGFTLVRLLLLNHVVTSSLWIITLSVLNLLNCFMQIHVITQNAATYPRRSYLAIKLLKVSFYPLVHVVLPSMHIGDSHLFSMAACIGFPPPGYSNLSIVTASAWQYTAIHAIPARLFN